MVECVKICPRPKELSEIVRDVHCRHCGVVFANTSKLEMHLARSHKEGDFLKKKTGMFQYFCPEKNCKYSLSDGREMWVSRFFSKLKYLKQHYQKVHLEKNYPCEKCNKRFTTETEQQRHQKTECQISFTCVVCVKCYSTRIALLTHCRRKGHSLPPAKPKIKSKETPQERKIVPKLKQFEPIEGIAAVALSELSWKVVVRKGVDVEVQTDHRSCRRRRVKRVTNKTNSHTISKATQTEKDLGDLSADSLLAEVGLPQSFTSSTQTNCDLVFDLGMFQDIDQHVNNHTQTELINQGLILDEESPVLSNTHTQTMGLDDYSHNYTQTCHDIFLNDFVDVSDIETQTAWASLTVDPCFVTAQTQTLL